MPHKLPTYVAMAAVLVGLYGVHMVSRARPLNSSKMAAQSSSLSPDDVTAPSDDDTGQGWFYVLVIAKSFLHHLLLV